MTNYIIYPTRDPNFDDNLAPVGSGAYLLMESYSKYSHDSTGAVVLGLFQSPEAALDFRAKEIFEDITGIYGEGDNPPWEYTKVYDAFKVANPAWSTLSENEMEVAVKEFYLATATAQEIVDWYYDLFDDRLLSITPFIVKENTPLRSLTLS